MELNADFSRRAVVHAGAMPWTASPMAGVDRRMLDRIGAEVARATSIVRYAPNSRFPAHSHGGGEEFFVLDGIFSDEHGHFPAGTYVRNPPTSAHSPASDPGCTIFVKLWQFDRNDRTPVRIDTNALPFATADGRPGVEIKPLFKDGHEDVRLERWAAGSTIDLQVPGGLELLVLDGLLQEGGDNLVRHSWLRLPPGARLLAETGEDGAQIWVKTGHLAPPRGIDAGG